MRARRLTAVALAFVAALAVFTATRGRDERAAAGPRPARADLVDAAGKAATAHDFRRALRLARRAGTLDAAPTLVDALVELGRYRQAERALQRLVDRKPALAAYARISYLRELHGDLDGAAAAMRRAVAAGAGRREDVASVLVLLGDLELARGRHAAARRAFAGAEATLPGHAPALAGRARLAAVRGDLARATALWRRALERVPLPEYALALGEAQLAAGDRRGAAQPAAGGRDGAARGTLDLVPVQYDLLSREGSDTRLERALFEADHGDARRAVALARAAWAAAPSVRAADALGWALTRAGEPREGLSWARRAVRLGSLDASFRFHAGMSALAAGRRAEGRRQLRIALAHGLDARPWLAGRAREALR